MPPLGESNTSTDSGALQSIVSAIMSQLGTQLQAGQLGTDVAGQQLGVNSALYGPGGVYQQQAQTQYGYQTGLLGLNTQGIQQEQGVSQAQQGIEQQQYGNTQAGLQQQLAENANQYGQSIMNQNSSAAASGATNTKGNTNALQQIGLYQGPGGFNEQDINRAISNAALGQQSEVLGYGLSQGNLQRALQGNQISGSELQTGLQQGIQELGLQDRTSADQILQQLVQGYENMAPGVASAISSIGVAGGIPQIFTP